MFGLPGLGGGVNPAQVKSLMKQMGIKTEDIVAERVIIEKADSRIVIENPNVQKIDMKGQVSWQIIGESREENKEVGISEEDVKLVMDKTGKSEKEVRKVLNETKDIAETIVRLS
ncbi:MAG: nascent polypeptide-associated complex protein [Nanoarchaeota archaeon]